MSCQARIVDDTHTFPGTETIFHTTKECGEEAEYAEPIDDGEAHVHMCPPCFTRYRSKNNWYGWFDYSFPPNAPIFGSRWYYENDTSDVSDEETDEVEELSVEASDAEGLCEKFAEITLDTDPSHGGQVQETLQEQVQETLQEQVEETLQEQVEETLQEQVQETLQEQVDAMEVEEIQAPSKIDEISQKIKDLQRIIKNKNLPSLMMQKYFKELIEYRSQLNKEKQLQKKLKKTR